MATCIGCGGAGFVGIKQATACDKCGVVATPRPCPCGMVVAVTGGTPGSPWKCPTCGGVNRIPGTPVVKVSFRKTFEKEILMAIILLVMFGLALIIGVVLSSGSGIRSGLSSNDAGICKVLSNFDKSLSNGDWNADVNALPSSWNYTISDGMAAAISAARDLQFVYQGELDGSQGKADAQNAFDTWQANFASECK